MSNIKMFLMDGCFHRFHHSCFKPYARKTLMQRLPNGDFMDCKCSSCGKIVDEENLRELLGPEFG